MLGVCLCMCEDFEVIMFGQFGFMVDCDYVDYIYLCSDFVILKGKKFQFKWNYINKFCNIYFDYEYFLIIKD